MTLQDIVARVAKETGHPEEVVALAYRSYWGFIRKTIEVLPLKEDLSEEEFNKLRPNFNLPSLGKFHVTYDRYVGMKKRLEIIKKIRENANTNKSKKSTPKV